VGPSPIQNLDANAIRAIARRAAGRALASPARTLRPQVSTSPGRMGGTHVEIIDQRGDDRPGPSSRETGQETIDLVQADCLAKIPDGGTLRIPIGTLVTPLAREEAWRRGIRLSEGGAQIPSGSAGPLNVAVGSDHGGFAMKGAVINWVREMGHRPVDLGCRDENPVDYPDYAGAVARSVAEGRCHVGICVDGAGIGSAMAANKVDGVRAANCWNAASAKNAREHNYANVLTLGGRMLKDTDAIEIVRTFLATPFGAERHGLRVDKIMAIERPLGEKDCSCD